MLSKTAWLVNEIEYEYLDAIIQQDQLKENNKKVPPPPVWPVEPELAPPAESENESESQLKPPEILES